MTWQVRIRNTRTGGVMVCGVTADSRTDAYRTLAYLPGAGRHLVIISIVAIPSRDER
jgi:hypothetical protein